MKSNSLPKVFQSHCERERMGESETVWLEPGYHPLASAIDDR